MQAAQLWDFLDWAHDRDHFLAFNVMLPLVRALNGWLLVTRWR